MSDGNFNRSHLPNDLYRSGLRAGKAAARQQAINAFTRFANQTFPQLSDEERHEYLLRFLAEWR